MGEETADNPAPMPPLELTLIVAATRKMGIGHAGTLPWTGLKKEMAYFARVTKRVPGSAAAGSAGHPVRNAVIMGRKTWESIPPNFRPLKDRVNIVISRSYPAAVTGSLAEMDFATSPVQLSSMQAALGAARSAKAERVFVIGGAEIYSLALKMEEARRILLTSIRSDFECDTFFPVQLGERQEGPWQKSGKAELDGWVGEHVPEGVQAENGIEYEFEMYEKQ